MAPSWVSASIVAARLEGYRQAVLQMMPIAKCVMGSSSCWDSGLPGLAPVRS